MANQKTYHTNEAKKNWQYDLLIQRKRNLVMMEEEVTSQDSSEKEADAVADKIVSGGSVNSVNFQAINQQPKGKAKDVSVQMQDSISDPLQSSKGKGQVLDTSTKRQMESQMNTDLSDIRIHTDDQSHKMNDTINAQAFTHGQDIYFNKGKYDPKSDQGKKLLAHELVHTQQQKNGQEQNIQRSIKLEFQTYNRIWKVGKDNKASLLPRKYGPSGNTVEDGDEVAYLTTGKHGRGAQAEGFVRVDKGEVYMTKAKKVDFYKLPQFIKVYQFTEQIKTYKSGGKTYAEVIGKRPKEGQLKLIGQRNFSYKTGKFNRNTFRFYYKNKDGTNLPLHIDEEGKFKYGYVPFMKVKSLSESESNSYFKAHYEEIYKVSKAEKKGDANIYGVPVKVDLISSKDNSKHYDNQEKYSYTPDTYEKKYYLSSQFTSDNKLKKGAKKMEAHLDLNGNFQIGHVKKMKKKKAKEQTAMELQSETHGKLEFETPKWFRSWDALKDRGEDAVAMTKKINASTPITSGPVYDSIKRNKETNKLGKIVKWPFSTSHLTNLNKKGEKLYVQILDENWEASVQVSEGTKLSEFGSLLKDNDGKYKSADFIIPLAKKIVTNALNANTSIKNQHRSLFSNLDGFIELIMSYILWGQTRVKGGHKDTFRILSRTGFADMHKTLLSEDERILYRSMLGVKKTNHSILSNSLETMINFTINQINIDIELDNVERKKKGWKLKKTIEPTTLTSNTKFYKGGAAVNPTLNSWLNEIAKNNDLLDGKRVGVPDAMGAKPIATKPGDKDYMLGLFEIRQSPVDLTSDKWVSYAKKMFEASRARSSHTPDDPSTPNIREASKTGLKK
ncbi:MAG: DUF4157 domain-containing protein [Flavobacteriales bacterium]|nr:DUF4157 domain-containing protein [Flavobacteriales bacterium]